MRFLFLSYSYPGPLGNIASWLANQPDNQIFFASSRFRQELTPEKVHRIILKKYRSSGQNPENYLDIWEDIIKTAKNAAASLQIVANTGFIPDIILNASINGINCGCAQIYPEIFNVNFLEEFPAVNEQLNARRQFQNLQIIQANLNFSFSRKLIKSLPRELRSSIIILPHLIDCDFFSPVNARYPALPFKKYFIIFPGEDEASLYKTCKILYTLFPETGLALIAENSFILRKLESINFDFGDKLTIISTPRQEGLRDFLAFAKACLFLNKGNYLAEAMSCASPCIAPSALKKSSAYSNIFSLEKLFKKINLDNLENELLNIGKSGRIEIYSGHSLARIMPELYTKILEEYEAWKGQKRKGKY